MRGKESVYPSNVPMIIMFRSFSEAIVLRETEASERLIEEATLIAVVD